MGDDYPTAWIEVRPRTEDEDLGWMLFGQLHGKYPSLFSLTQVKAFLLKCGKKSYKDHWKPLKKLRGLPEDLSDSVKYELKEEMRTNKLIDEQHSVSWYRLSELQDIDYDTVLSEREDLKYEDYKGRMEEIVRFLEQFTSDEFEWPKACGRDKITVSAEDVRIILWVQPENGKGHTTLEKEIRKQDWYETEEKPHQEVLEEIEDLEKQLGTIKSLLRRPEASEKFKNFLKDHKK